MKRDLLGAVQPSSSYCCCCCVVTAFTTTTMVVISAPTKRKLPGVRRSTHSRSATPAAATTTSNTPKLRTASRAQYRRKMGEQRRAKSVPATLPSLLVESPSAFRAPALSHSSNSSNITADTDTTTASCCESPSSLYLHTNHVGLSTPSSPSSSECSSVIAGEHLLSVESPTARPTTSSSRCSRPASRWSAKPKLPAMFATLKRGKNSVGVLRNQKAVAMRLQALHEKVKPLCQHFNLSYDALGEGGFEGTCGGVTIVNSWAVKTREGWSKRRSETIIKIRVRSATDPHGTFLPMQTLMMILFHELAHLKCMKHDLQFATYLRSIYRKANELGIFKLDAEGKSKALNSIRPWENQLYLTAGQLSMEELQLAFDQQCGC